MNNKFLLFIAFVSYGLQACEIKVIDAPGNSGVVTKILFKDSGAIIYRLGQNSCLPSKQASFKSDGTFIKYSEHMPDNNGRPYFLKTFETGMAGAKAVALRYKFERLAKKSAA